MDDRLHASQSCLSELVAGCEQRLLRLQYGQQVGGALPVLQLRYPEGFARSVDFARQMVPSLCVVAHLPESPLHVGVRVEHCALVVCNELSLGGVRQVFSTHQCTVENRLDEIGAGIPNEAWTVK